MMLRNNELFPVDSGKSLNNFKLLSMIKSEFFSYLLRVENELEGMSLHS